MAKSRTNKRFTGVGRDQRVRIDARRDDTRTFSQRITETTSSTGGTLWIFGVISIISFLLSWAPFVPEMLFIFALSIFWSNYSFKKKRWSIPFRVPEYINKKMGMKVLDATTGKAAEGNIFVGRCEESGEEVWAHTGDLNKHSLMIGTTGSGKTEAIMGHLMGFIGLNSGGLMVDGKASVTTFGSAYKIARLFGRDADLLTMDYLTGGIDVAGLQKERRSHTYNPLASGGPAQKSETMVSLLDGGDPMWSGRAMTFVENVIPPLSYLSDRGYIVLNPKLLGVFSVLELVENLVLFGLFRDMHGRLVHLGQEEELAGDYAELLARCGGIITYIEGLPGYSSGRPPMPHRTPDMTDDDWRVIETRYMPVGPQIDSASRVEVTKQHGFIQMQLTRSITNLAENYGFIYGAETGEIDFKDMVLNRRLMVVLLPALERSPENLMQLGKMTTLSLKAVLGSMMNTAAEGKRREIIDGNPSLSKIPFYAILDEVGYYMAPGLAVVPAQARSLGVALCFGTQSIPDLMKGDEKEGKSILDNTAVKFFGRLVSDENSDTAKTAISMGGEVHVQVSDETEFRKGVGGLESNLKVGGKSSLQTASQISYDDLARQENGEFHMIVGSRDTDSKGFQSGGARVVRSLAFYTGMIPDIEDWRRNPFCTVKPPSKADLRRYREAEIAARHMRDGIDTVLLRPSDKLVEKVSSYERKTYIGAFLSHRREAEAEGAWPIDAADRREATRAWVAQRLRSDKHREMVAKTAQNSKDWLDAMLQDIRALDIDTATFAAVTAVAGPWHDRAMASLIGADDFEESRIAPPRSSQQPAAKPEAPSQTSLDVADTPIAHAVSKMVGGGQRAGVAAQPQEDFIMSIPFGTHAFNDANHVNNFLRYLFSITKNHPTRETTSFNMVAEFDLVDGKSVMRKTYMNDNPNGFFQSYKRRMFADISDPAVFMDDGFYVSFVVAAGDRVFSNIVTGRRVDDGTIRVKPIEGGFYDDALEALGRYEKLNAVFSKALGSADEILPVENATPDEREQIERKIHANLTEGVGGRVVLSVSHWDQPTHSPHYHIHRIRMWEDGEMATVSQDEIEERNRTLTPYDGDRLPVNAD